MHIVYIDVMVTTRAAVQKITTDSQGTIKIFIKSAPEKGKANRELIALLSAHTALPHTHITIVKGTTTRTKKIAFATTLSFPLLLQLLGVDYQKRL